jgi:hypothetical protein
VREAKQHIETEKGEGWTTPDHQRAFPAKRARYVNLAAPGDEERWIVLPLHQDDGRMRVKFIEQ